MINLENDKELKEVPIKVDSSVNGMIEYFRNIQKGYEVEEKENPYVINSMEGTHYWVG